jgi:hypothetical protein
MIEMTIGGIKYYFDEQEHKQLQDWMDRRERMMDPFKAFFDQPEPPVLLVTAHVAK